MKGWNAAASSWNGVLSSRGRRAAASCSGRGCCEGQFADPVRTGTSREDAQDENQERRRVAESYPRVNPLSELEEPVGMNRRQDRSFGNSRISSPSAGSDLLAASVPCPPGERGFDTLSGREDPDRGRPLRGGSHPSP